MPVNLDALKEARNKPIKFIVLLRDVLEILASFIDFSRRQPDAFVNRFWAKTDEEKYDLLMDQESPIVKELMAVEHLMEPQNEGMSLFLEYDDLVSQPQEIIENIYDFLGVPRFSHQFGTLEQFTVNQRPYDDQHLGEGLHRVKTDGIQKTERRVEDFLPSSVIQKYGHLNVWKNNS
jgi:sulfotransferase